MTGEVLLLLLVGGGLLVALVNEWLLLSLRVNLSASPKVLITLGRPCVGVSKRNRVIIHIFEINLT